MKKILLALLVAFPLVAQEFLDVKDSKLLMTGTGILSIVRKQKVPFFQIEYRSDLALYKNKRIFIRPLIGTMITSSISGYIYGGIAFECFFSPRIIFTPSFAPGLYFKGKGIDLGHSIEFRSSAELAYRFENCSRLGVMFNHLSNASLGKKRNPGTECLMFYYAFPLN